MHENQGCELVFPLRLAGKFQSGGGGPKEVADADATVGGTGTKGAAPVVVGGAVTGVGLTSPEGHSSCANTLTAAQSSEIRLHCADINKSASLFTFMRET